MNYAWQMKKNGRAEITVRMTINRLVRLSHLCNIYEPEEVKAALANLQWLASTKRTVAEMYNGYVKFIGKTWEIPKYSRQSGLPFIPTESEIDVLIANGKPRTAALLETLKETAARIGEMTNLQWTHVDLERKTIYITAEKGSNSRILPISTKLIAMLSQISHDSQRVFPTSTHGLQVTFDKLKRRVAKKLNNARLLSIHLHTFRHWKATMEYHETKDIIHVKTQLGHKDIKTTMIYINLDQALFTNENAQWICKVSHNEAEELKLVEVGFELVRDRNDGTAIYRKRK
jgi:integrase